MSLAEGKWSADFHYRGGSRTAPIDNRAHLPGGRFAKRPYSNRSYSAVRVNLFNPPSAVSLRYL